MTTTDGDIRRLAAVHVAGLVSRPGLRHIVEVARRAAGDSAEPEPSASDEPVHPEHRRTAS